MEPAMAYEIVRNLIDKGELYRHLYLMKRMPFDKYSRDKICIIENLSL